MEHIVLFVIACMIIGSTFAVIVSYMPTDTKVACQGYLNATKQQVNYYCVCRQPIEWP